MTVGLEEIIIEPCITRLRSLIMLYELSPSRQRSGGDRGQAMTGMTGHCFCDFFADALVIDLSLHQGRPPLRDLPLCGHVQRNELSWSGVTRVAFIPPLDLSSSSRGSTNGLHCFVSLHHKMDPGRNCYDIRIDACYRDFGTR